MSSHLLTDWSLPQLLATITPMRPVGDAAAEAHARAEPSKYILKKEPLGVWADDELVRRIVYGRMVVWPT